MSIQLPEWLKEADTALLLTINGAHGPSADDFWFWAASKWTWIPFYAALLYILYRRHRRDTLILLPLVALMITCSDQLSTLLKMTTGRLRPCHEPALQQLVHLVDGRCGGLYGFVSSHASNTMALAVFLLLIVKSPKHFIAPLLIVYVVLNGYSRIYLAAHYPLDVVGGWALGAMIGMIFSTFVMNILSAKQPAKNGLG